MARGYKFYICGGPEALVIEPTDCPNWESHAAAPLGYIAWHEWAEQMGKTHRQEPCPGCGLLKIWVPKRG